MRYIFSSITILIAFALALPAPVAAQDVSSRDAKCKVCENVTPFRNSEGVVVTIIIKDSFAQDGVDAVIRQSPGASGATIIGLRRGAISPALVYDALASVASVRTRHGGTPTSIADTRLRASGARRPVPEADRAWIGEIVAKLLRAKPQRVSGVGTVPAITFVVDSKEAHKRRG